MKYFLNLFLLFSLPAGHLLAHSPGKSAYQLSVEVDAFQRGLTALKDNRNADALEEFTTAEYEHPDDPRVRNFRGIALARLGENAKAAAEYHEAICLDPRMEDAYRNLGFLKWTEHQLKPAREALEGAEQLSPGDSYAHYYLGRVELEAQRYSQALQELETSRVPLPADAGFSLQVATAYMALGRREDARKSLDHLVTLPLDDAQSIQVAGMLLAVHQNDAAIDLIKQLSKRSSPGESSWQAFDLALVYLLAGSDEEAIKQAHAYAESLPQGTSKSPEAAQSWSLIGIACAHLNQGEESVKALRQAATLAPANEEHWLNLTRELMELSRYSEAIFAVQDGLAANPKSYALHLRLGAAHLAAGHYAEAEGVFRDLVAAGDPLPTGYVGLAQVLLRTGRAQEAASELGDAEKTLGRQFLLSYFRGLALDRAGKPSESVAAFREAVQLNSKSAEAHLNLGKMELAVSHLNEAIAELQFTLRLNPGDRQAKRLLSQAYRRAGDTKNAEKFAEASREDPSRMKIVLLVTSSFRNGKLRPRFRKSNDK